jgi:hypothetical protein
MLDSNIFMPTPWDSLAFGMDTYEIQTLSAEALAQAVNHPGHYTIRVDPLASKKILHDYGFYYCCTMIDPYCYRDNFVYYENKDFSISTDVEVEELLAICSNVFSHGRFHRDFNLKHEVAETRYANWLRGLHKDNNVFALYYKNELAGFLAYVDNKPLLAALKEEYRGKGFAKYIWGVICKALFDQGHDELITSVSAANLSVVNLYASLGFRFRNSLDIYQRLVE